MRNNRVVWAIFLAVFSITNLNAKISETTDLWLIRQDFVKFGKKEAYETALKSTFSDFSQFIKKRDVFAFYAIQVLDSSQYIYLTPLGSYSNFDKLIRQEQTFQETFSAQDWEARKLALASTYNFYFRSFEKFLPQCSSIPVGFEKLVSAPYVHLYWIGILPGQEKVFEQHLQEMAAAELMQEASACWRVFNETVGGAMPQYLIAVFGHSEKEAEEDAEKLDFISGSYKQIVRKQKRAKGLLRTDLSLIP